jgi:transketolase
MVLPSAVLRRLAIEAGSPFGWERYIGTHGKVVAINRYGASGPDKILAEKFGFTVEKVLDVARSLLAR